MMLRIIGTSLLISMLLACQPANNERTTASSQQPTDNSQQSTDSSQQPTANLSGLKHPAWSENAVIYEVNIRQYTPEGTFNAFGERLPELQRLGVDILWIMPVQAKRAINPAFGSMADFKALVAKAHELGFKVILDWTANWDDLASGSEPNDFRSSLQTDMMSWLKEADLDGYSVAVTDAAPLDFWATLRTQLETIKPVFLLAKSPRAEYHPVFDMSSAPDLRQLFYDIAQGKKHAGDLENLLLADARAYPSTAYRMLFTLSQEDDRTATAGLGEAAETFAVMSYLLPGMPMIYNGQEAGLSRPLPLLEKEPIAWQAHRMRRIYQVLNDLKTAEPALWNGAAGGELIRIPSDNDALIYALIRQKGNSKVFAVFNLSPAEQEVRLSGDAYAGPYRNVFTGQNVEILAGESLTFESWGYGVLVK